MHILILQHAWVEAPGVLDEALGGEHRLSRVHLDRGERSPPLDDVDAVWVLGGPMDADEEGEHPWLEREKRVVHEAIVGRDLAYFGICLGHQMLAEALGGSVGPAEAPERGVFPITLTRAGREAAAFASFPDTVEVLQNHAAEVRRAPPGCRVLARSERVAVQALARGARVLSVQFHLESPPERALGWLDDDELAAELLASPGLRGRSDPAAALREHVERGNARAGALYRAWLAAAAAR